MHTIQEKKPTHDGPPWEERYPLLGRPDPSPPPSQVKKGKRRTIQLQWKHVFPTTPKPQKASGLCASDLAVRLSKGRNSFRNCSTVGTGREGKYLNQRYSYRIARYLPTRSWHKRPASGHAALDILCILTIFSFFSERGFGCDGRLSLSVKISPLTALFVFLQKLSWIWPHRS